MTKSKDNDTEERILEAAKKIFLRDGLQGARMQDIADSGFYQPVYAALLLPG
jgi:AcrR family transcriptional regulator